VVVTLVELKDIQLPETMKRAMARQAEAEREKRAKIIAAGPPPRSGHLQAARTGGLLTWLDAWSSVPASLGNLPNDQA
jgi:hypothetical protein